MRELERGTFRSHLGLLGGGKLTLLAELAKRGHAVMDEPGRRISRMSFSAKALLFLG
jgi:predicted ATPase